MCQPKERLPERPKEHYCEHTCQIRPLRAAAVTGHLSLLPREDHERNSRSKSLFPLSGVTNAGFHLQNKLVLSSNEPVFPACM